MVGVGLTFAYGLVLGALAPRRQLLAPVITHVLTDLVELTVAKTLGVLALLIPSVPRKVKEFALVWREHDGITRPRSTSVASVPASSQIHPLARCGMFRDSFGTVRWRSGAPPQ